MQGGVNRQVEEIEDLMLEPAAVKRASASKCFRSSCLATAKVSPITRQYCTASFSRAAQI